MGDNSNNRDFTIPITTTFKNLGALLIAQGHQGSRVFAPFLITNNTGGTLTITGKDENIAPAWDFGRHVAAGIDFQYPLLNADQTWIKSTSAGDVDITGYPV